MVHIGFVTYRPEYELYRPEYELYRIPVSGLCVTLPEFETCWVQFLFVSLGKTLYSHYLDAIFLRLSQAATDTMWPYGV